MLGESRPRHQIHSAALDYSLTVFFQVIILSMGLLSITWQHRVKDSRTLHHLKMIGPDFDELLKPFKVSISF